MKRRMALNQYEMTPQSTDPHLMDSIGNLARGAAAKLKIDLWGGDGIPTAALNEGVDYTTELADGGFFARSRRVALLVTGGRAASDPGPFAGTASPELPPTATLYAIPSNIADAPPEIRRFLRK